VLRDSKSNGGKEGAYLVLRDSRRSAGASNFLLGTAERTEAGLSTNRSKKNISDYRSLKFQVRSRDDWDTINRAVRGLKLPPQPPRSACTQTKDKWQTTCANLKFACIQKAAMVLLC
jgi:hypothetical protein